MHADSIKLIIFDLDGTLIDAYRAIISSFNYTLQRLGYPKQGDLVIRRAVGWGDEKLLAPFIQAQDLEKALIIYRRHHKEALIKESSLFAGVKQLLSRLQRRGYKLAVASNRPSRFSWILIRHLGLEKYFSAVLCSDVLRHGKPHPEILQKIMRRFRLHPRETVYVGDMALDAEAGRRAKVKTIIVTTGSSTKAQIKKERPYRIICEIKELLTEKLFSNIVKGKL